MTTKGLLKLGESKFRGLAPPPPLAIAIHPRFTGSPSFDGSKWLISFHPSTLFARDRSARSADVKGVSMLAAKGRVLL
jgi:hypothetical protein